MNYYEVQIDVPEELEEKFVDWLIQHMEEMVKLPCFYQADRLEVLDAEMANESRRFLCRYFYETKADMENYLSQYSQHIRGDLPEEWKTQLKFERRLGNYREL